MLEQTMASIMKFVIDKSGNPSPYYQEVPEGFLMPAVYFPVPNIESGGDTLSTYRLSYHWFIKFFHWETPKAHQMAYDVFTSVMNGNNRIPLLNVKGNLTGQNIRIRDPSFHAVHGEIGVMQLYVSWDIIRPYNRTVFRKMMSYDLIMDGEKAFQTTIANSKKD